ncbi:MAG: hypothetical protein ACTTG8_05025 [Catonella sp.]|uniref:hypothetical protein n=1 Tax=Catonella sp. TaxID=2382125 RepID=UPI003FA08FF7
MEEIMTVSIELEKEAERISKFRSKMKAYLTRFGACYDKFTITENDTLLGYISETAVSNYLLENYGDKIEVRRWADLFDLNRIESAVENNNSAKEEVEYVKSYFYDKYDLEIVEKKSGKTIFVDVKTAETSKEPQLTWNFLYPVVQNQREGKDCVILCYYYKIANLKKIILVGYISEEEISRKHILRAGSRTRFGTLNQIDNYETKVTDYQRLARMLNIYYGYIRREPE